MSGLYTCSTATSIASKVAPRQALAFLYPIDFQSPCTRPNYGSRRQVPSKLVLNTAAGLEAWFIHSLASAGNCYKHKPRKLQCSAFLSLQRPNVSIESGSTHSTTFRRQRSTQSAKYQEKEDYIERPLVELNPTQEELLDLVDQYSGQSSEGQLPLLDPPNLYQNPDGPHLTVSDKPEDEWPPPHYAWRADSETKIKLGELATVVNDRFGDPEVVYQLYKQLPEPRAPYLEARLRHKFLGRLSVVERKDELSMLRYLSVVDDMKKAAIPLKSFEWNSAISFAARYVHKSTELEVEAALHMWREMEQGAGVKGNDVTFNILFDVACKAGKYTLAEMIYKEMSTRGFKYNRFHHVSVIHYYGLKKNGDGARAAYKALVEAGEMVDTVVLNSMISALISSGEGNAAENIYERMKRMHFERLEAELPPQDHIKRRFIRQTLKNLAKLAKSDPSKSEALQKRSIIAPDIHTYRLLVNHFAFEVGDLYKTIKLLNEMKQFEIPVHRVFFMALMQGYAKHGGIRYTQWTDQTLESVWAAYMEVAGTEHVAHSRWMVVWALRAFAKCSGKARTMAAWEEVKEKWQPNETDLDFVLYYLRLILERKKDMSVERYDWLLGSL